jgi:hypothetical protein
MLISSLLRLWGIPINRIRKILIVVLSTMMVAVLNSWSNSSEIYMPQTHLGINLVFDQPM